MIEVLHNNNVIHLTDEELEKFKLSLDEEVQRRNNEKRNVELEQRKHYAKVISNHLVTQDVQQLINLLVPEHSSRCIKLSFWRENPELMYDNEPICKRCCLLESARRW